MNPGSSKKYSLSVFLCLLSSISASNVSVALGGKAQLPCRTDHFTFDAASSVIWTNPSGDPLSLNEEMQFSDHRFTIIKRGNSNFNLQISNVKSSDQGYYACKLLNKGTVFNITQVQLHVLVPPKMKTPEKSNISKVEGDKLELKCEGEGIPEPTLSWKIHKKSTNVEEVIELEDPKMFVVANLTLKNSGHYECQAENGARPAASSHYFVEVMVAPRIHVPYVRIIQKSGQYIFLQCIITWNPNGNVKWEFDDKEIGVVKDSMTSSVEKYMQFIEKIDTYTWSVGLFVHNFGISDKGSYKCHAINTQGSAEGLVDVSVFDENGGLDSLRNEHSKIGFDAEIDCHAKVEELNKTLVIWWKHTLSMTEFQPISFSVSGGSMDSSKYELVDGINLKIKRVVRKDEGYYMCSVAGSVNSTSYLSVTETSPSVDCNEGKFTISTVAGISVAAVLLVSLVFIIIIIRLRSNYQKLNTSKESTVSGTVHKLLT